MEWDFGVARELSELQKKRTEYQPELPPCLQKYSSYRAEDYMGRIKKLQEYLDKVKSIVKPGCSQDVVKAALSSMASVTEVLSVMSTPSFGSPQPL